MLLPWGFLATALAAGISWTFPVPDGSDGVRAHLALREQRAEIQRLFASTLQTLVDRGASIAADTSLFRRSLSTDPMDLASAFEEFSRLDLDPAQGAEMVDGRGSVLLWHGRTWGWGSPVPIAEGGATQLAVVDRMGAVVVLRVSVSDASGRVGARIHQPLFVDAPGLERLFGSPAFSRRVEEIVGRSIRIIPAQESGRTDDALPLVAFAGDTVAVALMPADVPSPNSESSGASPGIPTMLLIAAAMLLGWVWLLRVAPGGMHERVRGAAVIVAIWVSRFVLNAMGVPGRLSLGEPVDPRVYAAPSIGGLTASPLDLLISCAALYASAWWLERRILRDLRWPDIPKRPSVITAVLVGIVGAGALVYLTRGYVVAVRSIVFDSTVSVYEPTVLVPTLPVLVLVAALFLLTLVYRTAWVAVLRWLGSLVHAAGVRSIVAGWLWGSAVIGVLAIGFLMVDGSAVVPWWVFIWSTVGALVILAAEDVFRVSRVVRWIPHGIAVLAMALPTLDRHVNLHVLEDVQRRVEERFRPQDSWFSFLLTSDLHALAPDPEAAEVLRAERTVQPGLSAFRLWSRTLLSQQRLNSGIAVFDRSGRERDRFMAGIGTYEQQVILRAVFEGNEETVQTLDLLSGNETHVFHGAWSTVRGPGNEVFGTVALLVSATEQESVVLSATGESKVGRPAVGMDVRWHLFHGVKIALVFGLIGLAGTLVSFRRTSARFGWAGGFRTRLFVAFSFIALVPLVVLAIYNRNISSERTARNVEQTVARDIGLVQQRIASAVTGEEDLERGITDDFCAAVAADLGIEFSVFRGERLQASSRPELYSSALLEARMPAEVFGGLRLRGEEIVVTTERIGSLTYAVGYGTFFVEGRPAGVVAVPTLYRQAGIEEDLAERNAFLLVAAAGVFVLVLMVGGWLSGLIADPVRRLTEATAQIRAGREPASVRTRRRDELGTLMNAFDVMARELDDSRRRIAQAEREQAWREMAKQVAHEIKNPLTPIKLSLQHLRQAFKDKTPDREAVLAKVTDTVLEQVEALARIATEFSRFARLPERTFARVDVPGAIREAAALFAGVPGVRFQIALPSIECYVVADADELRRVFINLFRNSIQAMDDRGEIRVTADMADGLVRVKIQDSGPGIAEDVRSRVFEPSFSTKTEGMGLGLAIVRGVLADLGGSIELIPSSTGAEFVITLPVHTHV